MAHRNRWLTVLKNCDFPWRCEITRGHQKLYFSHPPTELFSCCCMFLPHCFALIFLFRFHPATSGGYAMRVPSPQNCRIWALAEFILPVGSGKTFHCTPGQNKQPTLDWTPRSNGGISWYMFWKTCLTVLIDLKQTQFTDVFNAFAAKHKLNIQAIYLRPFAISQTFSELTAPGVPPPTSSAIVDLSQPWHPEHTWTDLKWLWLRSMVKLKEVGRIWIWAGLCWASMAPFLPDKIDLLRIQCVQHIQCKTM